MEFNPAIPIYLQVMTMVKRDIVTGRLPLGERLLSVRDLAVRYSINPNTVSRVYRELEQEGACFTRRGMGTFVTEDPEMVEQMKREMADELVERFLEGMSQIGICREEAIQMVKEKEVC